MSQPGREGLGQRAVSVCPGLLGSMNPNTEPLRARNGKASGISEGPLIPVLAEAWGGHLTTQHPGGASGKEPAYQCRRQRSLGWEDPLGWEIASNSSILA